MAEVRGPAAWLGWGIGAVVVLLVALMARPYFKPEARWERWNEKAEELAARQKYPEAAELTRKALTLAEEKFGAQDARAFTSLKRLARLEAKLGHVEQARELGHRALDQMDKQIQELAASRNYEQAITPANESIEFSREVIGSPSGPLATGLESLAIIYSKLGRKQDAEDKAQEALEVARTANSPDNLNLANALEAMAIVLAEEEKLAQAEPLAEQALQIKLQALAPDDLKLAGTLHLVAYLYQRQFEYAKYPIAEEYYKRSLAIREKAGQADDADTAATAGMLARLYSMHGRDAEAEPLLEREIAAESKVLGPDHQNVYVTLGILAATQRNLHEYDRAEQSYLKTLEIEKKDKTAQRAFRLADTYRVLAEIADLQGHQAQAATYRQLQAAAQ